MNIDDLENDWKVNRGQATDDGIQFTIYQTVPHQFGPVNEYAGSVVISDGEVVLNTVRCYGLTDEMAKRLCRP